MHTRKRLAALRTAASAVGLRSPQALANPACVIGANQRCEHALVDQALNEQLYAYELQVRARFEPIVGMLRNLSAVQHETDFVARAQHIAQTQLGYSLPHRLLGDAWVKGLDLRALHTHCIFRSFKVCVECAPADQASWLGRMAIDAAFVHACGFHTVDISPCADGRLQGLLPFVFRMASNDAVFVKAYAGALFDVEADVADWTRRELNRLTGGLAGAESGNYLKIAVYHYSSSRPDEQGCAAHGSHDERATLAAAAQLDELRGAVDNTFGCGAAPLTLLVGMDTDTDAIRVHLPSRESANCPTRWVDSAQLFRDTLGMGPQDAREAISRAVAPAVHDGGLTPGLRRLIERLLEANLSQIEYVIQHHAGRYADIGHNECFICAGEAMSELQLRNQYYFAHLDTVEEGAPDLDVGIKIFTGLNVERGLAVPVLVHFHHSSRVPGARERAVNRCRRVKAAIELRYAALHAQGLLHCQMAVSDQEGSERCTLLDEPLPATRH